jgi:fibronectin type 3 domain-containing protein
MSLPVKATFRDLVPPPAPASLTPLIETKAIRLIWIAVEAADLAGYKLYRSEGVGHGSEVRDVGTIPIEGGQVLTSTDFVDARVDLGIAYRYAVTAIDKSGNESARVWTDWVVAPKTP